MRKPWQAGTVAVAVTLILHARTARAVPSFALQTGQPCTTCHIGAFGPQLNAFGRAFKIGGYVLTGGQGWQSNVPLSVLLLGSYTDTSKGQGTPASNNYGDNGNFAMDQISIFFGGRLTSYAGGLIQVTFDGIGDAGYLDNSDLRLTKPFTVGNSELQVGLDVNNNPTVQDPYNSSYAWGYPYVASALSVTPTAQPILAGGLAGNSIGATIYAWYDRALYLEGGVYNTMSKGLLSRTGNAYGPGATSSPAPYARIAYEWNWNGQSAHAGGIYFRSSINPATGSFTSDGMDGHDLYSDYAIDGGYDFLGDGTNIVSLLGIFNHEDQHLGSSFRNGAAAHANDVLNQARASVTYFYRGTYGATAAWQNTTGTADAGLYAPGTLSGSVNGKPNSNAYIVEADYIPFGKAGSWATPWVNLKLGLQYTIYTEFNGGTKNYDGYGRNASDNNTLYLFAWLLF
jgi:hypothetical protein